LKVSLAGLLLIFHWEGDRVRGEIRKKRKRYSSGEQKEQIGKRNGK
jgi:hypothetical protein